MISVIYRNKVAGMVDLLLSILLILTSCGKHPNKDYSYTIKEYQDLGVPDPNKVWNGDDIRETYSILTALKWNRPFALPRKDSDKSGLLFNRMVSLENMAFMENDSIPLNQKAFEIMAFLEVFEKWGNVYTNPVWDKPYYHHELINIYINGLTVSQQMLDLGSEIQNSNDPTDQMMNLGYPAIRSNYVSSLMNVLKIQSNTSHYLNEDLEILTDSLSASIIHNRTWMDSSMTNNLKLSLQVVIDSTSSNYIKTKYQELIESF